ncbi:hypothetical protein H6P81_020363 [Aristolochia fimbriata]|uniref:Uncharacterized protein n=1 Tax=Aristolochia fimbriata TaxID=158543 RepID=A0AAV7DUC3_ARIFI|nr:hypothetical protein H6P81_020363 [Aristolochia fimbriata]
MDEQKTAWFLDFLIRQPLDDWVIHRLVSILPVADGNIRLKKSLILWGIHSDILKDSISEKMLESLEAYERLVHQEGGRALHSMKRAYHAVALECCVRFLREEYGSFKEFACAVDGIWKGRVSALEMLDGCNLITDQLRKSKKEMVAALRNYGVRNRLLGKDARKEAMDSIKDFWEESMKEMGPPYLESLARQLCGKRKDLKQIQNEHSHDDLEEMGGGNVLSMKHDGMSEDTDRKLSSFSADLDGGNVPPGEAEAPITDVNCTVARGCANQDSHAEGATDTNGINSNHDPLSTKEVRKLQGALITSYKNLKSIVTDPLPEALKAAEKLQDNSTNGQADAMTHDENQSQSRVDRHDAHISKTLGEISASKENDKNDNGKSRPDFMARNQTARTYEWNDDESGDSLSDNSSHSKGVRLPSPSVRVVAPLNVQDTKKFARRRKARRWSTLEEETLRSAVLKYGRGNWKLILQHYRTVFEDRTEIDLKDKWRNMVR